MTPAYRAGPLVGFALTLLLLVTAAAAWGHPAHADSSEAHARRRPARDDAGTCALLTGPDLAGTGLEAYRRTQGLLGLALAAGLYTAGRWRLRRRGRGRARPPAWRAWCYGGGLAVIGVALLSPVDAFGERLFFVHMIQHLLLVLIAPPLVWLGAPLVPSLWALPLGLRRGLGRLLVSGHPVRRLLHVLAGPLVAAALYMGAIVLWHLPSLYDAAQGRSLVHDLEHLTLFGTALLYWWVVVHPSGGRRRLRHDRTLLYLVPPMVGGDLIGVVLSVAPWPLYAAYQAAPRVWDLSVVADQRLGGLIMWVGGGLFWLAAIAVVFFLESDDDAQGGVPCPVPHHQDRTRGRCETA